MNEKFKFSSPIFSLCYTSCYYILFTLRENHCTKAFARKKYITSCIILMANLKGSLFSLDDSSAISRALSARYILYDTYCNFATAWDMLMHHYTAGTSCMEKR